MLAAVVLAGALRAELLRAGPAVLALALRLSSTDSVTSSITAMGALSPLRGPTLVIRV